MVAEMSTANRNSVLGCFIVGSYRWHAQLSLRIRHATVLRDPPSIKYWPTHRGETSKIEEGYGTIRLRCLNKTKDGYPSWQTSPGRKRCSKSGAGFGRKCYPNNVSARP